MSDVKNYETKLKKRLVELASDDKYPKETEKLLNAFREKAKILEERQKKEEEEAAKAKALATDGTDDNNDAFVEEKKEERIYTL